MDKSKLVIKPEYMSKDEERDIRLEIEKQMWEQYQITVPETTQALRVFRHISLSGYPKNLQEINQFIGSTLLDLIFLTPYKLKVGDDYEIKKLKKMGIVPEYISGTSWDRIYQDDKFKLYWSEGGDSKGSITGSFRLLGDKHWIGKLPDVPDIIEIRSASKASQVVDLLKDLIRRGVLEQAEGNHDISNVKTVDLTHAYAEIYLVDCKTKSRYKLSLNLKQSPNVGGLFKKVG